VQCRSPCHIFTQCAEKSHSSWKSALCLFVILCFTRLGVNIVGGEEHYLTYAKQFMDPSWIPGSFILTEFAGTRVVYQYIAGSLLRIVDFPAAVVILRLVGYVGLALGLSSLHRNSKIPWTLGIAVFMLFIVGGQSFFGGEWIFYSTEPKIFAYIFLFFGLSFYLREQWLMVALCLAIGCHFHFLVTGWFVLYLGIDTLLQKKWMPACSMTVLFGLLILPFFYYLYQGYLAEEVACHHDLGYVYNYYRVPHHTGVFKSVEFFIDKQLSGVIKSLLALFFAIYILLREEDQVARTVARWVIIIISFHILFLILAYVDAQVMNHKGGFLLSYYPFRSSAMAMYLSYLLAARYGYLHWSEHRHVKMIKTALILFCVAVILIQTVDNVKKQIRYTASSEYKDMCAYIKETTPSDAIFVMSEMPFSETQRASFLRLAQREPFAIKKLVPATKAKMCEWYTRQLHQQEIAEDCSYFAELKEEYQLDYLITLQDECLEEGLKKIYQNAEYIIYQSSSH